MLRYLIMWAMHLCNVSSREVISLVSPGDVSYLANVKYYR